MGKKFAVFKRNMYSAGHATLCQNLRYANHTMPIHRCAIVKPDMQACILLSLVNARGDRAMWCWASLESFAAVQE